MLSTSGYKKKSQMEGKASLKKTELFRQHTLSLYEDPEQRMGGRHGLAEVVVVVDGQQVAVDVGVADHHLHVGDAVDVQYELVELLELARLDAVHREPAELGAILRKKIGNRSKRGEEAIRGRKLPGRAHRKGKRGCSTLCTYLTHLAGTLRLDILSALSWSWLRLSNVYMS